ncbi:MAG: ABC transporter ATP-binding protein [Gammaproteobacteria bacterium]|nr:ABC transporter ATP-binding protein [Gammaproteobacteria bacterium]
MNVPVIEARGVTRTYGEVRAVDGVDLDVAPGEIFGLIGHNGAGKSTLIRLVLGLVAPQAGEIRCMGVPVLGPAFRDVRRQLAYLPENVAFYENLTGLETLHFYAKLKGLTLSAARPLLDKVGLAHAAQRPLRGYSKGMRQRLGLAQALLGTPRLLVLDEPTTGLDPAGIREFYGILEDCRARGMTIILSSHNLAEIEGHLDRLALMSQGRVRATGNLDTLSRELDLPVQIALKLKPGVEQSFGAWLARETGLKLAPRGEGYGFTCTPARKMSVLAALATRGAEVLDIDLKRPSLEDVYLEHTAAFAGGSPC